MRSSASVTRKNFLESSLVRVGRLTAIVTRGLSDRASSKSTCFPKDRQGETDAPPEGWSRVCVLPCGRQAVRILADWLSRRVLSKNPSI
jgi:hypothetical protein